MLRQARFAENEQQLTCQTFLFCRALPIWVKASLFELVRNSTSWKQAEGNTDEDRANDVFLSSPVE